MSPRASSMAAQRQVVDRDLDVPQLEVPARAQDLQNSRRPASAKRQANQAAVSAAQVKKWPENRLNWWIATLVGAGLSAILLVGWLYRDATGLRPGNGLGYWLGIVGGLTILAVLGYPMRKYMRSWRNFGSTAGWFSAHMLLGTVGPAIVLFHAGFQLGAFNSNVALITMLFVAGSGIVGRYLYGRIHVGLHGRRAELSEMTSYAADMRLALGADLPEGSPVWSELLELEALARAPAKGLMRALHQSLTLSWRSNSARRHVARDTRLFINQESRRYSLDAKRRKAWHRAAQDHLESYFNAISSTARLILFERMFGAWHLLHVPLFIVMTLSVIVHIVAVHFY